LINAVGVTLLVMRDKARGLWSVVATIVIAVALFWALYAVSRSPYRGAVATYGAFAISLVAIAAGWAWRRRTTLASTVTVGNDLDDVADFLATSVQEQWTRAALERRLLQPEPIPVSWVRSSLSQAGPATVAGAGQLFAPLPGFPPAGEMQLAGGHISDLHAVYGGLGSGRLVIAGAAGSGKTGGAVLLVLAALAHRAQVTSTDRPQVPVPVLVTARDWDPGSQEVGSWLVSRMCQTYPLFAGKVGAANAAALVDAGKVAVILDGLDEIADELQPIALRKLNHQPAFRVVVLSRTVAMASIASQQAVLEGAAVVELCSIDPTTAAEYLRRTQLDPPPAGWDDLIDRIRSSQGSSLAKALDSPLTLTLVRDTYRRDDVRELLDFYDYTQQQVAGDRLAEEITDHLLDRVLPAAYASPPWESPVRYELRTAQRTLAKIAAVMNQDSTRDLQWWRLPDWAPAGPRTIVVGLGVGTVVGLAVGRAAGLGTGLVVGLGVGLVVGLAVGPPRGIGKLKLRRSLRRTNLMVGLAGGIAVGVVVGLVSGLVSGLVGVLVVGLVSGLGPRLMDAIEDPKSTDSPSPPISWRNDQKYALVGVLLGGLVGGLGVGLGVGLHAGIGAGISTGLLAGIGAGIGAGLISSQALPSSLASVQLARRWHTPVRLMKFLDDADQRGILRTVGPVYQFRHARLQDRLAGQDSGPPEKDCGS
jgi:hypothetical protein